MLEADWSADTDCLSDVANPYGFTGRRRDGETGLMQVPPSPVLRCARRVRESRPDCVLGRLEPRYSYGGSAPVSWTDPTGEQLAPTPITPPARKTCDLDTWLAWYDILNPKAKKEQRDFAASQARRGCVGLTCANLGPKGLRPSAGTRYGLFPDMSRCFENLAFAQQKQKRMEDKSTCPKGCEPHIYSMHFWSNGNEFKPSPKNHRVDMNPWLSDPAHWHRPPGGCNYDFGWLDSNNRVWHANHAHHPPNDPMMIYDDSIAKWQESYWDFDKEVWCVACQDPGYSGW